MCRCETVHSVADGYMPRLHTQTTKAHHDLEKKMRSKPPCVCVCGGSGCASNRGAGRATLRTEQERRRQSRSGDIKAQAASLENARRRGQPWSGEELDLLGNPALKSPVIAEMTGRTIWAVRAMRKRLNREPKLQRVTEYAGHVGRLPDLGANLTHPPPPPRGTPMNRRRK